MAAVRPAAVAGMFYPRDPGALSGEVAGYLAEARRVNATAGRPKALVVPHAGYVYSGAIAACAFRELEAGGEALRRVVLLGPAHRAALRGIALPGVEAFATPLGVMPIDAEAVRTLSDLPQIVTSSAAHAAEHSLEVQLPFLQRVLGPFSLVPLAVGMATAQEVAEVLERLWGGPETLIIVSTDLSHYHAYAEARRIDGATLGRIGALATDLDHEEACGATPLNGLLQVARRRGLQARLLAACNSGDTAGDRAHVVGYAAFALEAPRPGSADRAHGATGQAGDEHRGRTLLAIARGAIAHRLGMGIEPATDGEGWLEHPAASFVTLRMHGGLRGCIGSLEAARPLGRDVAENARAAAFRDPRFQALSAAEWPACRVEVSLLSAPEPLRFAREGDLLDAIRAGIDGLILEHGGRRGTFLPQVWEDLPDKRRFLDELKRKAGIAPQTSLELCTVSRYEVRKWREPETPLH